MSVKNLRRTEEFENNMSALAGVDIKTLRNLRKCNLITRDHYRYGLLGNHVVCIYKRKMTLATIEELRRDGYVNKRRKRNKV